VKVAAVEGHLNGEADLLMVALEAENLDIS
jgi:hypothetical protein